MGYFYGESFKKRYLHLKEANKAIIFLQNEVIFNTTPLPEALLIVGEKTTSPFKEVILESVKNLSDDGLYKAFKKAYLKKEEEFYFYKEDKNILEDFLKSLGSTYSYGQEKIFNLALENLKVNLSEALELSKVNTKMYRYLGVCFGAMILIFII
ncbi:MAG: stage III sporulation protein AB [Clostridium sp.]|nr:stage III sporulation protein AB [Clostridium sp.]MCI7441593.1 stage III sporulation protein AB [Clostridium sp.]